VAITAAIFKPEDRVTRRAGPSAVVAVAPPTIIANVVVTAATFVVAALVTDIAILFALGATNRKSLVARNRPVRTMATSLVANLPLAIAYQTRFLTGNLTGADTSPDALAVLAIVDAQSAIAALSKRLASAR